VTGKLAARVRKSISAPQKAQARIEKVRQSTRVDGRQGRF
jgi:hypothetical protein